MESVNMMKGYGKVNDPEDQSSFPNPKPPTRKPLSAAFAISAAVALTLVIALVIAILVHKSHTEPPKPTPLSAAAAIKAVCNVTQYPATCVSTLSSANLEPVRPDPVFILKLSLQAAISELQNLSSSIQTMLPKADNSTGSNPLYDCKDLFDDAVSRLNDSLAETEVKAGEKVLTGMKVSDIQTWVSAASTDEETCLDGLEETGSPALQDVKEKMEKSKEVTTNSLAIVANINNLLEEFGMKMP